MTDIVTATHPKTECCGRILVNTAGLPTAFSRHEADGKHFWGIMPFSPTCCRPSKALWLRRECTCLAIQWIRRDELPAGYPLSTAKEDS